MDFLKQFTAPEAWWALIGLALVLMEFVMPGLIIVFFGLGAFVVAIVCAFANVSLNMQLILFIVASVVMLLALRRWLKTIFVGRSKGRLDAGDTVCEFVGERAMVERDIAPNAPGKIAFHGSYWAAEADDTIAAGTPVRIVGQENITLKVERV